MLFQPNLESVSLSSGDSAVHTMPTTHSKSKDAANAIAEVNELIRARIEEETRESYRRKFANVGSWLHEDGHVALVTNKVVKLDALNTEENVLKLLSTLKKHLKHPAGYRGNAEEVAFNFSTFEGYSAAMAHYFRTASSKPSDVYTANVTAFVKGVRKTQAKEITRGERSEIGKRALSIACYQELCEIMTKSGDPRFILAQAMLKAQFNIIAVGFPY